jgi:peptidyl-prolyl cis-trans isomerase D
VRQLLIQDKSAELAKVEGQARLASWKADPGQASLGDALTVSRDQAPTQPQAVIDAALRADPAKLPALVGVDLGSQGYAVVRVNKMVPRPEATAQQAEQSRQQFARLWGQAESQAYLDSLKSTFKVQILAEKPKKLSDLSVDKP